MKKEIFSNMWTYIIGDIEMAAKNYLAISIVIGLFIVGIMVIIYRFYSKSIDKKKMLGMLFFAIYIAVIFEIAYFSREPGSRNSLDLQLFSTWGQDALSRAYVIENVIMFLPFGFITPYIWRRMQRFFVCIAFGVLFSISIELLQLMTERGYCQLDDVVMNVLGAVLGHLVYRILIRVYQRYIIGKSNNCPEAIKR